MRPQIKLALVALLLIGCAAERPMLITSLALAQGRADGVQMLVKADHMKQTEFRTRARATTTLPALDALEAEYKAHNEKVDKALLAFEDLGKTLAVIVNSVRAGTKVDLVYALAAYKALQSLLSDMHLTLPAIPGVN